MMFFSVSSSYGNNKNEEKIDIMIHQMFNEAINEFFPKNEKEKKEINRLSTESKTSNFNENYFFQKGDLDNDGVEDVVAMSNANPYIIAVLHGQKDGSFKPWTHSQISCAHMMSNSIEIKKQSIFITESYDSTAWWEHNSYQFKYRNGKFVLIGADSFSGEKSESNAEDEHKLSYNYLTNQSIETIIKNGVSSEKKVKLKLKSLQELNQFSGGFNCHSLIESQE
jgi:hypothetical protein